MSVLKSKLLSVGLEMLEAGVQILRRDCLNFDFFHEPTLLHGPHLIGLLLICLDGDSIVTVASHHAISSLDLLHPRCHAHVSSGQAAPKSIQEIQKKL